MKMYLRVEANVREHSEWRKTSGNFVEFAVGVNALPMKLMLCDLS
jgi:hypothetical protein